jgi:hypothetical protein
VNPWKEKGKENRVWIIMVRRITLDHWTECLEGSEGLKNAADLQEKGEEHTFF